MLRGGAAVVRAGDAGVFIDNSALSHGGGGWVDMADFGRIDAVSYAFVSIIFGEREVRTLGMHVLGFPDFVMQIADLNDETELIFDLILYICGGDKPIGDGHLLGDENGPRFRAAAEASDPKLAKTPMFNPFGRLRLTSMHEIAEGN